MEVKPMRVDRTRNERAARVHARKLERGLVRVTTWIDGGMIEPLKREFPGIAGGIDWPTVAKTAMEAKQHQEQQP